MDETRKPDPFCHIVIPAPDLERAQIFYESVFGWRVHANVPGPNYWFFESGNLRGAFDAGNKPSPKSVVLVIRVVDMGTTIYGITKYGGTMTQDRSPIGDAAAGYDAYFVDPNGNEMGLYADS